MAKEDGNGEPDPVWYVSEAVHSDGAHMVRYSVCDTVSRGRTIGELVFFDF